jgi:hypothetical protein
MGTWKQICVSNQREPIMSEMTVDVSKVAIPVWVHVYWSESGKFKDNELIPFKKFEAKALAAAKHKAVGVPANQQYYGYYKTKVKVLFTSGDEYECRLDLALGDTTGFKNHAAQLVTRYENVEDDSAEQEYLIDCFKENYEFLKTVVWPE